jgi:hypothetical protein
LRRQSDIFISYAQEDRPAAQRLAQPLEALGWAVWWDRVIAAGRTFDEVIEEAIESAKCVVVLWSKSSVRSRWVRAEAEEGASRGVLVPVMIEQAKIPLAFRRIQAADLIGWDGSRTPGLERLIADIASLIGQSHDQLEGHVRAAEGTATEEDERPKAAAHPELQNQPPSANAGLTLESQSPLAGLARWRRWLLLYWPRGVGGWVFRLLFLFFGVWSLVGVVVCISGQFRSARDWGFLGGLTVTTWLCWRAASWFDKRVDALSHDRRR